MKTRKSGKTLHTYARQYMEKQLHRTIDDARIYKDTFLSKRSAWKQHGGVTKTIEIDPYIFKYDETNDRIIALSKKKRQPCFRIDFFPDDKIINIDISYYSDCCYNQNLLLPDSNGVQIMLNAAIGLLFQRRDILKYTKIYITDNSGKNIETEKGKEAIVNLADMYFVCSGCTWYSTLIPMFLEKEPEYKAFLDFRKHIIGDVARNWVNLLADVSEKCAHDLEEIRQIYGEDDVCSPGSASRILNVIRLNREYSYIFYNHMDELLRGFGVSSLYGKESIIPLRHGKIITCLSDPIQSSCKNKGRWLVPDRFLENVELHVWAQIMKELQEPVIPSPF